VNCFFIVSAPTSPEPFQTLGMIYEELGDMDKSLQVSISDESTSCSSIKYPPIFSLFSISLQFALISAYLCPNDAEEWTRLAEMSLERGDIKQAITGKNESLLSFVRSHLAGNFWPVFWPGHNVVGRGSLSGKGQ